MIDKYLTQIQEIEIVLKENYSDRELLINQTFLSWYVLVEGNLESDILYGDSLKLKIKRNYMYLNEYCPKDSIINFLIGWMAEITPWLFDDNIQGMKLLRQAYEYEPGNLLFKWAIRNELNLRENEIVEIKDEVKKDSQKYIYGFLPVQDYFYDIFK
jgi:hypothetical protein